MQLRKQAALKKAQQQKVAEVHAAALEQDPSVFDYDGVYDDIKRAREDPRQRDKAQRKSKYVEALLEKAQERKMEESIRRDD